MTTTELATKQDTNLTIQNEAILEKVVLSGDLSDLTPKDRVTYYSKVCESLGLNPLTRPFDYIKLNNKLTLYPRKDCTDQLRASKHVSINIMSREVIDGIYIVTAQAIMGNRKDESTGAIDISKLAGEFKANAMMKAETKAKRRVTLSIVGLGVITDEVDSNMEIANVDISTGEIEQPHKKEALPPSNYTVQEDIDSLWGDKETPTDKKALPVSTESAREHVAESLREPAKNKRDPATIHTIGELFQSALDDWKMQPGEVLKELNMKSKMEIVDPAESYRELAAVR